MKSAEKQYLDAFEDELSGFKSRVMQRAKVRIEDAIRTQEEEERKKRLGPGGLDPVEVMETLPQELKECFETKSVALLQTVLAKLPKEEAAYHMKRCIDSGLWVPDAKAAGRYLLFAILLMFDTTSFVCVAINTCTLYMYMYLEDTCIYSTLYM